MAQQIYETVAAGVTNQVIGATGAAGDLLDFLLVVPTSLAPGAISVKDGSGTPFRFLPAALVRFRTSFLLPSRSLFARRAGLGRSALAPTCRSSPLGSVTDAAAPDFSCNPRFDRRLDVGRRGYGAVGCRPDTGAGLCHAELQLGLIGNSHGNCSANSDLDR